MNKSELERYRRRLEQIAARVKGDADAMTESTLQGAGGQAQGELSNAPMHLGDMGTEEFLRDLNATLLENEEYLVNEAYEALRRIREGTFGKCFRCDRPIVKERLDALPHVRYCVQCAEIVGSGAFVNLNEGRPRRPEDTLAPEGDMDEDRSPPHDIPPSDFEGLPAVPSRRVDTHAAGTPGGGSSIGGLAGTNTGYGDPEVADLQEAMGRGDRDTGADSEDVDWTPKSGPAGGAVGGTPAGKRTRWRRPPQRES